MKNHQQLPNKNQPIEISIEYNDPPIEITVPTSKQAKPSRKQETVEDIEIEVEDPKQSQKRGFNKSPAKQINITVEPEDIKIEIDDKHLKKEVKNNQQIKITVDEPVKQTSRTRQFEDDECQDLCIEMGGQIVYMGTMMSKKKGSGM